MHFYNIMNPSFKKLTRKKLSIYAEFVNHFCDICAITSKMGTKIKGQYEWVNILDDQEYEWVRFFEGQVYEYGSQVYE